MNWRRTIKRGTLAIISGLALNTYAQVVHLYEDFNTVNPGELPAEWYLGDGGTVIDQAPPLDYDSTWTVVSSYFGSDLGDGNFVFIRYNTLDSQDDTLYTDTIDLTSITITNLTLIFKHYFRALSAPNAAYVGVKVFDGANWTLTWVDSFKVTTGGWGASAATQTYSFDTLIGTAQKIIFLFRYLDSDDWYWAIDQIMVYSTIDNDIAVSNVYYQPVGCPSTSDSVYVVITNSGTQPQDFSANNITVTLTLTDPNSNSTTRSVTLTTGILNPGSSDTVAIKPFDLTASGNYSFTAYITYSPDQNNNNDTLSGSFHNGIYSLPEQVDFTGYTGGNLPSVFPAWDEATGSIWGGYTVGNTFSLTRDDWANDPAHPNGDAIRRNFFGTNGQFMIISKPFASNSSLDIRFSFDYVSTDFLGTALTDAYNNDDSVIVYYSTDCGANWNMLGILDSALLQAAVHPDGAKFSGVIPNTPYVTFAIYMKESSTDPNNRDINFYVDNINIDLVYSNDLELTSVVAGTVAGCPSSTDTVKVTITNVGAVNQTFGDAAGDTVYVYVTITGANTGTQMFVDTIATGSLLADSSLTVSVAPVNFMPADTYTVSAYLVWALDQNNTNDTLSTPVQKVSYYANLPQRVDFTGYTGSNLSAVFPGWEEADGTPTAYTITNTLWTSDDWANISGHPNGTAIRYNMWSSGYRSIMFISPLINVPANVDVTFTFDNVIVDWGQTTLTDILNGGDSIIVYYTTNCGLSWTPIYVIDSTNAFMAAGPNGYEGAYIINNSGFNFIQFAFRAVRGANNNTGRDIDIMFDNINIDTIKYDLSVTSLNVVDNDPCPSEDSIFVTIKNTGGLTADFSANSLTVNVSISGPATGNLSTSINANSLLFAEDTTLFVGTFDFSQAGGMYQLMAYLTWGPDGDATNDSLTINLPVALKTTTATQVDFNSWDGTPENLFQNYDFWWENEDFANDNSWEAEDWTQIPGTPNDTAAEFEFWGSFGFDIAMIGSPAIKTNNYNAVYFGYDVALTDRFSPASDTMDIADTVFVAVSFDCGSSWYLVTLYTRGNEPDSAGQREEFIIPTMGSQYVQFLFFAKDIDQSGYGSASFYLDNINVAYYDLATSAITTNPPSYACDNQNVDVSVKVLNNSTTTLDSLFYSATAYYNGSPIANASGIMNMSIASGATATLNNILSFTMPDTGSVAIRVVTRSFPVDFDGANDTLWLTVEAAYVNVTLSLPDTAYSGIPTSVLTSVSQYGTTYDDIVWDFGPNATPQTANGTGPFSVAWNVTSPQYETVTVTVYYCNYSDTIVLQDSVFVTIPSGIENAQLGNLTVIQDRDMVTLNVTEGDGIAQVRVRSLSGKELFVKKYSNAKQVNINMKNYPAGIYMLEVVVGDTEKVIKITKE